MYEDDGSDRYLYVQSATQLTNAAIEAGLIQGGATPEETAENVLYFFEMAFRRIQDLTEEETDYLEEVEGNGENEPL
jgi:hypothetical protein